MCLTYVDGTEVALQGEGEEGIREGGKEGKGVRLPLGGAKGGGPRSRS